MAKIIQDFGERIPYSRKHMFAAGGITEDDLRFLTERERIAYVRKDFVWPFNAAKLCADDNDVFIVFMQQKIRRHVHGGPQFRLDDDSDTKMRIIYEYVKELHALKELVMDIKTEDEMNSFLKNVGSEYESCVDRRSLRNLYYRFHSLKKECLSSSFPFVKRPRKKASKKAFIPPQLERIEREGEDVRHGVHVSPEIWQKQFNFRGVQFGNWTSQKDRQFSMDYCFDAFVDLAAATNIANSDIAFGGKLALAFGARGRSSASAHYEPVLQVINLTKMHGAGCTAHEWMHALDYMLAEFCGISDGIPASESGSDQLPASFVKLVKYMKTDDDGNETDFYRGSKEFDNAYRKAGHGYWASNVEMLARAFACYCKDTLGFKSDYLFAHADVYTFQYDDMDVAAVPQGDERDMLNELFDVLFCDLKKIGFLHERPKENGAIGPSDASVIEHDRPGMNLNAGIDGQFAFAD